MSEEILSVKDLTKRFGGFTALDAVNVSLSGRERMNADQRCRGRRS